MAEADEVEKIEFKWGKKRGVGGKKKDVQFYESFTYDGVEYALYDSVYLFKEGDPEPYIGKLIKIWENSDKSKKVKILWYFRPCEILNYIGVEEALENELFLASGEGLGLANVNPLEVIAGKCNVVCISKESRNPQPSDEELKMADFMFYRTFHIEQRVIVDKIDERIAGIEAKFIFNRVDSQKLSGVQKLVSDKKEVSGNAVATDEAVISSKQNTFEEHKTVKRDGNSTDTLAKKQKSLLGEKPACSVGLELGKMAKTNDRPESMYGDKITSRSKVEENAISKVSLVKQKSFIGEKPASTAGVEVDGLAKTNDGQESISRDNTSLRAKVKENADSKALLVKQKSSLREKPVSSAAEQLVEMAHTDNGQENISGDKTSSRAKVDSSELNDRPSKKPKLDESLKVSDDKHKNSLQKFSRDSHGTVTPSEDKSKLKLAKDSQGTYKGFLKPKPVEKLTELMSGKLPKSFSSQSLNDDNKTGSQVLEVTRRPDADRSKWFKGLPWEERMQSAQEQGTLVLLQNLDPAYTSAEVEDIVWHGFKESCTAKMIQRTTISSPHSGQALVIFKTREAAEVVSKKLDEGCLLLSNGRPLVGSIGTPRFSGKQPTFFGHLAIDKLKLQMQRELKLAVSTSHCSQPNTIEYDMAMEWCLLQERSDRMWKKLYEQQGQELRKLKASMKSK